MYKLTHQVLSICGFNFERESLVGYVNMHITPLRPDLRAVYINCQQCCIHKVLINEEYEARYMYADPTLDVCQEESAARHNVEMFDSCHRDVLLEVNPDNGKGEICILLPDELLDSELKPFQVIIEFSLVKPKGGMKFVVPDTDGTLLERGAHLFTYSHENSSRLWFPCIDSYSEVCTWKLEFTVSMYMIAVSCGDLIETIYTSDLRQKTYHYYLPIPTAAPNIALAVGPFVVLVDPNMHEVTNFCLPGLLPLLKHTTSFIHTVFEFYEELLSTRYPYSCYKQVFVDMAHQDVTPYATMTICNTNLLHTKKIIDQTPVTLKLLSKAIAQQFFGCYISMNSWNDAWLVKGLTSLLCSLYQVKMLGYTDRVHTTHVDMKRVCEYELNNGPVVLDPSKNLEGRMESPHALSPSYLEIFETKSHLVMRLLEKLVGNEFMRQVMNKLLVLASNAAQQKFTHPSSWSNMVVSTASFTKCIMLATGKDVSTYMNQWVYRGGAVVLVGRFTFNRKRNTVELELKQDLSSSKNVLPYAGPISVVVQELDGTFNHHHMIEETKTKFDITCHSKSRRQKKRKIPLSTGEEVEMNLDDTDVESPVLWLRIDPDMSLLRIIKLDQPEFMWRYMLGYERCVVAQLDAIQALEKFPGDKTRHALSQAVDNEKFFPKIREAAAFCLMKVENAMGMAGSSFLVDTFKKVFGSPSSSSIIKRNNFSNFHHYYLQKALPLAISQLRNDHGVCPGDVIHFLLSLIKFNDNSNNKYSDCYYKATLVDALANTVTPAVTTVSVTWKDPGLEFLTGDTKLVLEEIVRYLNMEKLFSCYKYTITVSCLRAIRRMQRLGHIPSESHLFKSYAVEGNFVDIRLSALEALVDYTEAEASSDILNWLLNLVEDDKDSFLRFKVVCMLISNPPFKTSDSSLNTTSLKDRLWDMINSGLSHDCRLRCAVIDLYKVLYTKVEVPSIKDRMGTSFSPMDTGCSRDGMDFTRKRRHSGSSLGFDRRPAHLGNESWGDVSGDDPFKIGIYHSDHSSDEIHVSEDRKESPVSLDKVNSLWSSIYPSSPSPSHQGFSSDQQQHLTKLVSHSESMVPKAEMEVTVQGEGSGEMNLSELSSSDSSRESSPKRSMGGYKLAAVSPRDRSHPERRVASFLSEEDDDDDDVDFENFSSNTMGTSVRMNNSMFNKTENDDDDDDDDDVGVINLMSNSSAKSRHSSDDDAA